MLIYITSLIPFVCIMEVECSGGGVLIFSYLILKHQLDDFGVCAITLGVISLVAALMARQ